MLIVDSIYVKNNSVKSYMRRNMDYEVSVVVKDTETNKIWIERNWRCKNIFGVTDRFVIKISDYFWKALDYIPYVKSYEIKKSEQVSLELSSMGYQVNNDYRSVTISLINNFEIIAAVDDNDNILILGDEMKAHGVENSFVLFRAMLANFPVCVDIFRLLYNIVYALPEFLEKDSIVIQNTLTYSNKLDVIEIGLTKELRIYISKLRTLKGLNI